MIPQLTTADWLLGTLLLAGLGLAAAILYSLRHRDPPRITARDLAEPRAWRDYRDTRPEEQRPHWIAGTLVAVALIGLFSWLDGGDARLQAHIERQRLEEQRIADGYIPRRHERVEVNLNHCPPRSDGMTDQVVMVIIASADGGHEIAGCSRIAERQFMLPKGSRG